MKQVFFSAFSLILFFTFTSSSAAYSSSSSTLAPPVNERPLRILPLTPALAELVADLIPDHLEKIIGVPEYTDEPPALKSKPSIGPYHAFNLETAVSLKPDLVIATTDGNPKEQVERLRSLKFDVLLTSSSSFVDILESITKISKALRAEKQGAALKARLESVLKQFDASYASRKNRPKVLLQVGSAPLVIAGKQTFLSEAIERLGCENVFGDLAGKYIRPSLEEAIARDPDLIIVFALGKNLTEYEKWVTNWKKYTRMKASREKQVFLFQGDALLRPSARLADGLLLLERRLNESHKK